MAQGPPYGTGNIIGTEGLEREGDHFKYILTDKISWLAVVPGDIMIHRT